MMKTENTIDDCYTGNIEINMEMFFNSWPEGCQPAKQQDSIIYLAKLRTLKFENPAVIARNFKEFSSRVLKVDCQTEPGQCCLIGHTDNYMEDGDLYYRRLWSKND